MILIDARTLMALTLTGRPAFREGSHHARSNAIRRGLLPCIFPMIRVTVIRKPAMPVVADPAAAVRAALEDPVGAQPLAIEARDKSSACILINDITRPVPNALLLRPIVTALLEAGMAAERIVVLVATGLHRPNLGAELEELVGDPWVLRSVRVENHDASDDAAHAIWRHPVRHAGRTRPPLRRSRLRISPVGRAALICGLLGRSQGDRSLSRTYASTITPSTGARASCPTRAQPAAFSTETPSTSSSWPSSRWWGASSR